MYFPRRSFDMWNSRYFVLPIWPNGWRDEFRGYAAFLDQTEQIYPNPAEFQDVISTTERLAPIAAATGGSSRRLAADGGIPKIAPVSSRAPASGRDWIGLRPASGWSKAGVGAGWAALYDVEGRIGQVAMSIAVTLLEG